MKKFAERIISAGPLSETATYRLIVKGAWTVKEIDRLIASLRLTGEFLQPDTSPEAPALGDKGDS